MEMVEGHESLLTKELGALETQLNDLQTQLTDELNASKIELADAKDELADAKDQLADAAARFANASKQLVEAREQVEQMQVSERNSNNKNARDKAVRILTNLETEFEKVENEVKSVRTKGNAVKWLFEPRSPVKEKSDYSPTSRPPSQRTRGRFDALQNNGLDM